MKTLLLMRHAKSSWADPGLADHERPLNGRGKRDAKRMGRWLRDQGAVPDRIVTSSAVRALRTARRLARAAPFDAPIEIDDELYHGSPAAYWRTLAARDDDADTILVIGHNPDIEDFLSDLTGRDEIMPTAAIARIEVPAVTWKIVADEPSGNLVQIWRPKELPEE